jgi:N-acetylglucosaminyl-diphospho-decaprenol L-rhamnosyltransferase
MISILTVNYRSSNDVAELAASILRHADGFPIELIVTNNSYEDAVRVSPDGFRGVTVLPSTNRGYAAGVNLAYRHSHGEIIMVTNPDVRLTAGVMSGAVGYLQADSRAGVVLPLLRYPTGEIQMSVRRFYTWPVAIWARLPLRLMGFQPGFFRRYLYEDLDRSAPVPVDWGLGGAMFLRRCDCDREGIFDERFFMYFEDVDLCYRMWQQGRTVIYYPQIECVHAHRRLSRNPISRSGFWHLRSFWRFFRKYGGLPGRPNGQPV